MTDSTSHNIPNRRPIAARGTGWASGTASWLVRRGVTPNQISVASVVFAAVAGGLLVARVQLPLWWATVALLLAAVRSEEHTSELQSRGHLVCRLVLEK